MSRIIHQSIVYLLLALLPLQVFAVSGMALCANMPAEQLDSKPADHCAKMAEMASQSSTDNPSSSHPNDGCWLGSICLASLILPPIATAYADMNIERSTPIYPSHITIYRSIISDNPLRPPATL